MVTPFLGSTKMSQIREQAFKFFLRLNVKQNKDGLGKVDNIGYNEKKSAVCKLYVQFYGST